MLKIERVLNEIKSALEQILIVNGYKTDIGTSVVFNDEKIDENSIFPITVVAELSDSVLSETKTSMRINLPVEITGIDKFTGDLRKKRYEIFHDIKKCLLLYRRSKSADISEINYQSHVNSEHENGSQFTGVKVIFNIIYFERPGDPEY